MGHAEIAPLAEKVEEPPHAHTKAFYSLIAGSGANHRWRDGGADSYSGS